MADVFISYKRENLQAVQRIVQGLRGRALSVWWDQDIAADAPWEAAIERELAAAKVVIVAWSQSAAASENVKAEARRARTRGKLIQVFVEACEPPLFFGERQGVDLSEWNGAPDDNRFQAVLAAARAIVSGKRPSEGVGYTPRKGTRWATLLSVIAVVSAVLGIVANLGGARDAACSATAVRETCVKWGVVRSETDPAAVAASMRSNLLRGIEGRWGRQDRDCSDVVTYSVTRGQDGVDRITAHATNFESVGQVIAAENGVVISRTTTPSDTGAREQWEFRPDGDRLVIIDKDGVSTTLVRCGT